jgi:hypothetical protein
MGRTVGTANLFRHDEAHTDGISLPISGFVVVFYFFERNVYVSRYD